MGHMLMKKQKRPSRRQIDSDSPIPYLMLKHQNKNGHLEDYIWHWFILAGYEETEDDLMVKAVSYGEYKWFSLKELWDTGYDKKGGMILYHIQGGCIYMACSFALYCILRRCIFWKQEKY